MIQSIKMGPKFSDRYEVPPNEDYEPGSNKEVLKNYLSIKTRSEIEKIEAQELKRTEFELVQFYDQNHQFTVKDICNIHQLWLGDIYPFAGKYRTVMMSKAGFPFANPEFINKSMKVFEKQYLQKFTPCHSKELHNLAYLLGVLHVEFIIIHPFREGNGRIARLLANLMSLQAGYPPVNFQSIDQLIHPAGYNRYISAIQNSCIENNYSPIQKIFTELLLNSID